MKKRFWAAILLLCMVLGMLPGTAWAADSDFTIKDGVLIKYTGSGGDVTIPDSVIDIGAFAFSGCTSLTNVTIPNSVTKIGYSAFDNCYRLTSVTIPDSVTTIGPFAFDNCSDLNNVVISNNVTSVGHSVFSGCRHLTGITIPNSVKSIEYRAFAACNRLTSVTIPDSVDSIDDQAFCFCDSLKDVYYAGDENRWDKIEIGDYNDCLTSATIHYNSTVEDNDRTATVLIKEGKYTDNNGYGAMPSIPDDGGAAYIPAGADGLILEFTVPTTSDIIFSDDNVMYDGYPNSDLILVDLVEGDCGLRATEAYIYDEHKILSLAFTGTATPGTLDITFAGFALANAPGQLLTDKDGHLLTSNTLRLVVQGNDTPDETGVRVDFFPNGGTITSIRGYDRSTIYPGSDLAQEQDIFVDTYSGIGMIMSDKTGQLDCLPVIERDGYTFDGWWYTDNQNVINSAYDNEITDFTGMQRVDLSTNFASLADSPNVIAKWNKNSDKSSGDLNGDGKVTMADVLRLARGAAGYVTLTEQERTAGDVTGDGKITMADVIRIARYAAGHSSAL